MSSRRRAPGAPPSAEQPHADDLGVLLTLALGAFKQRLHAHLAHAGYDDLGASFGFVLRSLDGGPLSLVDLARRLGISAQGALKIATEMVDRGYVERQDDPEDKRVRRLLLTSRGRDALREARRFHSIAQRELVKTFGERQVAGARAVLHALAAERATEPLNWGEDRPF
jgi:DNA-binding MarR family transcriptional regulator